MKYTIKYYPETEVFVCTFTNTYIRTYLHGYLGSWKYVEAPEYEK